MSAVALHDDGWAIRIQPPGRRDLGCYELWERSLARVPPPPRPGGAPHRAARARGVPPRS